MTGIKPPIENMSVLVADKNVALRSIMRTVLNALRVEGMKFVDNGEAAFKAANSGLFDGAIIDRDLETHSGLTVVNMLRLSPESKETMLPIIMMAANWEMSQIAAARDVGVNEYLVKPFSQAQVEKRLDALIRNPRHFINGDEFFGPDRRRMETPLFKG